MEVSVLRLSGSRLLLVCAALAGAAGVSCGLSSVEPSALSGPPPALAQITPSSSAVNTSVTVTGSGFAPTGNVVKFGRGYIRDVSSPDGTTLRFNVPDGLDLCAPDTMGPCPGGFPEVMPGEYEVAVITNRETSNALKFTVTRQ